MFDRLKRPRRGKGAGDGSDGGEAEPVGPSPAEPEAPTFGRRAVPVGKDAEFEPPRPAKSTRSKKSKDEDFSSEPVEDSPATNWRKATPIAPGEEVKLVRVYKKAEINTGAKPKQPAIEIPPDESKLTFKREKRFYFAGDAEEEKAKAQAKAEAEAAQAALAAQQTEALLEADNVTPLNRRQPHADADMAKLEAARAEAARRETARVEADRLEAANREAARLEEERLEAAKAEAAKREALRLEAERIEASNRELEQREIERLEAARAAAAKREATRREAEKLEVAARQSAQRESQILEAAKREAARVEATRREAAKIEEQRLETVRAAAAEREAARQEAEKLEAAAREAARLEAEKLESAKREAARIEAARQEAAKLEAAKLEAAKADAAARESTRREAEKLESARREAARVEAARLEAAKLEAAKLEAAKHQAAKSEAARLEAEKLAAATREAARLEAEKLEAAKREAAKVAAARQETAKLEAARQEAEKLEAANRAAAQREADRIEAAKREAAKLEAAMLEARRIETESREAARVEAARLEVAKLEAAKLEALKLETAKQEAAKRDAARLEAEQLEAANRETAKREAERLEAARVEAARLEAAKAEAEKAEAARLEAERLEAEKREAARSAAKSNAAGAQPAADAKGKAPLLRRAAGFLSGIVKTNAPEAPDATAAHAEAAPTTRPETEAAQPATALAAADASMVAAAETLVAGAPESNLVADALEFDVEPAVAEPPAAEPAAEHQPPRAGGGPNVEHQLKAKFAEVVARKEPAPAPTPPADSKDRIAAIFRKVQTDSTKRTAPEARAKSSEGATDRIASIMRKGLNPGNATAATSRPNSKPAARPSGPAAEAPADSILAADAPKGIAGLFETAPAPQQQAAGKVAMKIVEWLKSELSADPDMNHATVLTVIGALAGYAAQRAIWEGVVVPGALSATDIFEVRETEVGEKFYFCAETDKLIGSLDPRYLSIWKIVTGNTRSSSGEHPEVIELLAHCAASIGTPEFGIPRLPDGRTSNMPPREAVNRLWAKARQQLAKTEPTLWPMNMAVAARSLVVAAQRAVPLNVGIKIVMEAAVPMSRIDPATVPRK